MIAFLGSWQDWLRTTVVFVVGVAAWELWKLRD